MANEVLERISKLSNIPMQQLLLFCKNKSVSHIDLSAYYMKFGKLPSDFECANIRKGGQVYINSL